MKIFTKAGISLLTSSGVLGASLLLAPLATFAEANSSQDAFSVSLETLNLDNPGLELTPVSEPLDIAQTSVDEILQDPLYNETPISEEDPLGQVTNVNQLRDVSPGDWAFEALRNLVERYGCIAGYPSGVYLGNRAMTRYEFAAGLNACLGQIERLIASSTADFITRDDLSTLEQLVKQFEGELATLGTRVDDIEARVASLEDNQFSTTTKLVGEVAFTLAQAFGDGIDSEVVFNDKIRLTLVSSFSGKDKLFTRLTAGNIGPTFQGQTGTREGRLAHDGLSGNNVIIDRLHYVFPVGDNLKVTTMAVLGAHHFYADVFNDGINSGGGANGGISRFSERSPIYRLGIGRNTVGIGLNFKLSDILQLQGGYLAPNGSNPADENGLFDGRYSALGQLVFKPNKSFKLGLTYVHGYDALGTGLPGAFPWGGTGTNLGNLRLSSLGVADGTDYISNSYGVQAQWNVGPKFSLRGWFNYTDFDINGGGDAETISYAGVLAFPDLGKEGNLGAIVVGVEPYLTELDLPGADPDFEDDPPFHIEAFYKYQLNKNISITPGVIWLTTPNQDNDNNDILIGVLRTTFKF